MDPDLGRAGSAALGGNGVGRLGGAGAPGPTARPVSCMQPAFPTPPPSDGPARGTGVPPNVG
jgi:hypothetical protein